MQLISKFNKRICFLLCVIDTFIKYAWVVPLKDKKDITITNDLHKLLTEFNRKPKKMWVDKGSEFYNRLMKSCLQDNDIEMYSTYSEGKYVAAEIFIRNLKNKFYKYMTSVSKNVHIDKLGDIVNECNNTYHSTIKTKPFGVKSSTYIDFGIQNNKKDSKFEVDEHVRKLNYKNIFAKGYVLDWSEKDFVIKK